MKKLVSAIILIITSLSLSSCSTYIRKAVPITIANPGYESYRVAIAVDYFGVKHIARSECPIGTTTNCKLIYSRAYSGGVLDFWTWSPTASYSGVDELDIAVTDSGVAVLVWNTTKIAGGAKTTLYMVADPPLIVQELMPGYVASGEPLLVSRFAVIYALSSVIDGSNISLRYQQVLGGSAIGWVSEHGVAYNSFNANAAVSPSGWLYVAYRGTGFDILYADNYGITGDMTNRFLIMADVTTYIGPAIDVNGVPETVYLAYYEDAPGSNDTLYLGHCPANACSISGIDPTFVSEYPLNTSKHWSISGLGGIVADAGTNAYYTFSATNDDTAGDYEIFEGFCTSGVPQVVANISNMPGGNDYYPAIGLMASYIPVTTWVHSNVDIYVFDTLPGVYQRQRKIHTASHGILSSFPGWDISCNADWGAGIWNEDELANRAFIIFNTYPAMLPMIKK
jgi:hypothetical protein